MQKEFVMRKNLIVSTMAAMLLMGIAGGAFAQSDAMEEAEQANNEPMNTGSGVTTNGSQASDKASGHSDAANQSMDAVEAETNEKTDIQESEDLDDIDAEGHSDAAGDAIESQ
ncbi:hypothetical protein F0A16_15150 [Salinicola corii]|uniref:Uncharacterized protein n=1 Tax=Salinicola corii TaxID=2606937 RepID=A0A640WBM1_9GAMM|nr:hypothetical protein [Salinicola corii]KAA0016835.1 hypothetical protein F0A16_15150 [Salinicola corii]